LLPTWLGDPGAVITMLIQQGFFCMLFSRV
jgi:hypothetical protein